MGGCSPAWVTLQPLQHCRGKTNSTFLLKQPNSLGKPAPYLVHRIKRLHTDLPGRGGPVAAAQDSLGGERASGPYHRDRPRVARPARLRPGGHAVGSSAGPPRPLVSLPRPRHAPSTTLLGGRSLSRHTKLCRSGNLDLPVLRKTPADSVLFCL